MGGRLTTTALMVSVQRWLLRLLKSCPWISTLYVDAGRLLLTQWAAVSTHDGSMRDAPQIGEL